MTNLTNSSGTLGMAASNSDSYVAPNVLLSGSYPIETSKGTLLNPAADLPAFSLIGRITASNKLTLSVPGASDGSQVPVGVTTSLSPNTGADHIVTFYRSGSFNYNALNKDAGWTLAALRIAIETAGTPLFFDVPHTATPTEPA